VRSWEKAGEVCQLPVHAAGIKNIILASTALHFFSMSIDLLAAFSFRRLEGWWSTEQERTMANKNVDSVGASQED
jgi:hypothetical protein